MTKNIILVTCTAALFLALSFSSSSGQVRGPQLILTWRAETYVPPGFLGKALPTAQSPIVASVAIVDTEGRMEDLSAQTVYWRLNDKFLQGGVGLTRVEFRAPDAAGDSILLSAELPSYDDTVILETVEIPVVTPIAVIEAPLPGGKVSGGNTTVRALPYFFNVKSPAELSYAWSVNGETPKGAENPEVLQVMFENAPAGSVIEVNLLIRNARRLLESAQKAINLTT